MKKFFFVLAVVVFMMGPLYSFAAGPYSAPVNIVSIDQNSSIINVVVSHTDPAKFQNVQFLINNAKQNEQLAILLTAMAANKGVKITYYTAPMRIEAVQIIN